ncbi:MAG: tRNA 2-thiocytidine(32) synthetase TtcA [Peptoniphilaceae bacterium]|nr:tRNA 2-thiocytidine(32) synthetase TtcA [Peptoniphilaceae bacterium]MDD7383651.1 ATP-binding protein [Peptoniphilaceae bacterium]
MIEIKEIERSIIKKYRKELRSPFIRSVCEYELANDNDKIAVAISGGKDSLLLAKLMQELHRHSKYKFELEFICMDPGYEKVFRKKLEENLKLLEIPAHIFDSEVFAISEKISGDYPCYMCARMRRGNLYAKAKELGCNKIALGHHFNDVIETTMMNVLFSGNFKTMKPKLKAQNFKGMQLIRPLYKVHEEDIIKRRDYIGLNALNCACSVTKKKEGYTRLKVKNLIKELKKEIPDVDKSIFKSAENVNCDMVLGFSEHGVKKSFLDEFKKGE